MIQARDLHKSYGRGHDRVHALRGVDLNIAPGELVAITGASGSGKSTLLHILGCLVAPDQGQYLLAGEEVSALSSDDQAKLRSRRLGLVFRSANLLSRVSALENVELPMLYAGMRHAKKAAIKALRGVGLAGCLRAYPDQLSAGQRQRVAIARAMVAKPLLLLADEPTGNLDSETGRDLLTLFRELHAQGQTIVMVTHDAEVAAVCPRRILLRDGQVVEEAPC